MFRPSSLGHQQVASLNRGSYTIYDTINELNHCCLTRSRFSSINYLIHILYHILYSFLD